MSTSATGTFDLTSWRPEEAAEGSLLGRARITKSFQGDLTGTSTVDMLTVADTAGNPVAYVAVELVTGELGGRKGSFALQHSAPGSHGERLAIQVVPGTGTGDLTGITGTLEIVRPEDGSHSYTLEYTLV
ncbi:DUF3224 domain-containing protein [Kitasatospora sp. NPDC050543]|uniref:DUF3224 domain-containing protein n=1 Tax=Kitasatospora sp. NPDC050543 TaxID=3364054 RepID=UPI0037B020A1